MNFNIPRLESMNGDQTIRFPMDVLNLYNATWIFTFARFSTAFGSRLWLIVVLFEPPTSFCQWPVINKASIQYRLVERIVHYSATRPTSFVGNHLRSVTSVERRKWSHVPCRSSHRDRLYGGVFTDVAKMSLLVMCYVVISPDNGKMDWHDFWK